MDAFGCTHETCSADFSLSWICFFTIPWSLLLWHFTKKSCKQGKIHAHFQSLLLSIWGRCHQSHGIFCVAGHTPVVELLADKFPKSVLRRTKVMPNASPHSLGATGQFPHPKSSKTCLVVRHKKSQSFPPSPQKISAVYEIVRPVYWEMCAARVKHFAKSYLVAKLKAFQKVFFKKSARWSLSFERNLFTAKNQSPCSYQRVYYICRVGTFSAC